MKLIRIIHKWIGLVAGVFFFISCISGMGILIGKLTGSYAPVFSWMKTLHRTLFLNDGGRLVIGIATFLMLFEMITGYLLWGKTANGLMRVARKQGKGNWKGFCRSLSWTFPNKCHGFHVAAGFWAGLPLLLMILTGLTWSFDWFNNLAYAIFDPDGSGMLFHTIARLHTGSFWNTWSRLLWLVFSIFGCSLSITGWMIFCKKLR